MLPALQQSRLGTLVSKGYLHKIDVEIYSLVKSREEKPSTKDLVALLKMLVKDFGAKDLEDWELMRIATFVQTRYSELSVKEIKTAFEYAITGEYEEGIEVRHFGNFSIMYISRILNAFRQKARESLKIVRQALPEPERKLTEDEIKIINSNFLLTLDRIYSDFLAGKEIGHRVNWIIYDWLDVRKMVTLTKTQKKKCVEEAKKILNQQVQHLNIYVTVTVTVDPVDPGDREATVKTMAKGLAVISQFTKFKFNGIKRISDLVGKEKTTKV